MSKVSFILSQVIGCYASPSSSSQYGQGTHYPKGLTLTQLCSLFFKTNWNIPKVSSNLAASYTKDTSGDWFESYPYEHPSDQHESVSETFGSNIILTDPAYADATNLTDERYLVCNSGLGLSVSRSAVHSTVEFYCPWSGGYKVGDLYYPEMTLSLNCNLGSLGGPTISGGLIANFDSTKTASQISSAISDLNSRTNYYDSAAFDDLGRDYVSSDIPSPEYQTASVTFTLPGGITVPVSGYILPTYTMTYTQKLFEDPGAYAGWWANKTVDFTSNCSVSTVTISTAGSWSYS
jgi:hypothetical protein